MQDARPHRPEAGDRALSPTMWNGTVRLSSRATLPYATRTEPGEQARWMSTSDKHRSQSPPILPVAGHGRGLFFFFFQIVYMNSSSRLFESKQDRLLQVVKIHEIFKKKKTLDFSQDLSLVTRLEIFPENEIAYSCKKTFSECSTGTQKSIYP